MAGLPFLPPNSPNRSSGGTDNWSASAAGQHRCEQPAHGVTKVNPEDISSQNSPAAGTSPSADARLVEQLRRGDAEARHRFFREYYPRLYRYLLWLAQRPELAEDLT